MKQRFNRSKQQHYFQYLTYMQKRKDASIVHHIYLGIDHFEQVHIDDISLGVFGSFNLIRSHETGIGTEK